MIPLFKQYPSLKEKLPYIQLGEFPTPILRLNQLGKKVGAEQLYLKNDGVSGPDYGGNKIRKLEFILGDALKKNAKAVLTFGFAGSNHALATAVYAHKLGLQCLSILLAQPNAQYVRKNLLFSRVCCAEVCHCNSETAAYIPTIVKICSKIVKHGKLPYIIAPGGSSPLGTIGYVNAGLELNEQIESGSMPKPDRIFVALGTMGTAVGLLIGLKAAGLKTRVVSVRVADEKYGNKKNFAKLFHQTLALIQSFDSSFPSVELSDDDIDIRQDYFGEQYARFTKQGMAAKDLAEKTEGIKLDGTYTGKTMAAMLDHIKDPENQNEVILFWNTYNAIDFSKKIGEVDCHCLPQPFQCYFDEDVQPLDSITSHCSSV